MTWRPKYLITERLLRSIREIGEAIGEIRSSRLSDVVLAKQEWEARELSTHASTSIEGNPLGLTEVKRLLKSGKEQVRDTEREVVNYNAALQALYSDVRENRFKLNVATLEKVQSEVVAGLMDNPAECGRLRRSPVVIRNPRKLDEIIYIPPDSKDVQPLTAQLTEFVEHRIDELEPVVLAGLFHRQCVIIHPFMDGNGRTTRLLTTAILGKARLDLFEAFSFENYYNQSVARYFKAVGLEGDYYELRENIDFTAWLEYFAEGILDELLRVRNALESTVRNPPRLEPHHRLILEFIGEHGSITQREYGAISPRSLASRKLDFKKLRSLELIEGKSRGRGTYYVLME